ncbi:hypothetical protein ACFPZL_03960 [Leucobacter soli]|uniref:DUF2975 domain-containing protein n=1 Tax=Leucobacter soli TaxID=2812850 RepID=A0A916NG44_9MICO|nr:hypothetical protein [Leucobacter soli]CAG7604632.1 hypothetical protein LEUCIP111803_00747 [Leucobacter soli]
MNAAAEYRPSRADRIGIVAFMIAGIAILAWSAYAGLMRVMELLLGEDARFLVRFPDTPVETPLGEGGAPVALQLDAATIAVRQMTPLGFWSGVLEQSAFFVGLATVVVCLLLLSRRALRGEIFSRSSTALVAIAGLTGLAGFGLSAFFQGLAGAEALLSVTGGELTGFVVFTLEPFHFVIAAFVTTLVINTYAVGARIERETAGLI